MKPIQATLSMMICFIMMAQIHAQNQPGEDSTGLPGDHFSLQGALEMFQKAGSPEEFEKLLNTKDNHVNNLDLNGDGDIDYIRVVDKTEKDLHAFVLQVPVSEKESQDIAVVELEKTGDASAIVQIIGDADIYGEEVIVEPDGGGDQGSYIDYNDGNNSGPSAAYHYNIPRIVVNVWLWPTVRFVYAPSYRVWASPWRWRLYPVWWKPWRPLAWHVYHPLRVHYHRPFVVVHTHRVIRVHKIYTPGRVVSASVRTRHSASVNRFRVTRTKTTITGPGGRSATRTKTTVTGKHGKVKATKTKIRRN